MTLHLRNIGDEHAKNSKGRKQIQIVKHLSKRHSKVPLFIEQEWKLKELYKSEKERSRYDIWPYVDSYLYEGHYYYDLRCEIHKITVIVRNKTLYHSTDYLIVKDPF